MRSTVRWLLIMGLLGSACGSNASEVSEGASPAPLPAQPPAEASSAKPAAMPVLDEALCTRIDTALAQAVLGKTISKAFGVVEDTESGKRLRCEWQGVIRSLRASIYPDPSFWNVVVATDNVGSYPNPFPAWQGEARSNPFGFAFRLKGGGAVNVALAGGKPKQEDLVALGRAIEALVEKP